MSSAGLTIDPAALTALLKNLQLTTGGATPAATANASARPNVNANMNPIQSQYIGNSFQTPGFQTTNPTNIPHGMLPPVGGHIWESLTQSQRDRLLAQYGPGQTQPYQPPPQTPSAPITGGTLPTSPVVNPAPLSPVDWVHQIQTLFPGLFTPTAPGPVTVTPPQTVPDLPPPNATQEPKLSLTDVTSIDLPPGATPPPLTPAHTVTTPTSKPDEKIGDVTVPYDDTTPGSIMPGLLTGGPLTVPTMPPTAPITPIQQPTNPNVTIPFDDTNGGGVLGGGGGVPAGAGLMPGGLSGGPAIMPNDFGTSASGKTGAGGQISTNDAINAGINVGGIFAPPGVGALAGLLKGAYEGINNGDTYQTKGGSGLFNTIASQLDPRNPGMGEKLGLGIFGGQPQLPISAGSDPSAQSGSQSSHGGLTPSLIGGGPAVMPSSGLDGAMTGAGNAYGVNAGGWMNPSLNYTTDQLGNIDLSGFTNFMQSGKGAANSPSLSGGMFGSNGPWGGPMFVDVGPMSWMQQMNLGT